MTTAQKFVYDHATALLPDGALDGERNMMLASLLMIVGMPLASTVADVDQNGAAPAVDRPAKPVKEAKVCRRAVSTGSIMPVRTCRTAAEWAAIDQINQGGVDAFSNRPRPAPGKPE